nr:unnamed protein product [Callosobruchus analis]
MSRSKIWTTLWWKEYGGKNMEISRDKVFISLSYSPRTATLKRKFGNLPIGYMRERIDKEEDFKILDRVGRRYHFNLLDEQVAGLDNTWMEGEKRELYHQPPTLLMDDTDDDDAADTGGDANEVSVSRISRHQVKRNKGGEASTSATAAAARVDNSSNDDAVVEDLDNTLVEGVKRKLYHQQPTLLVDDTDDDDDDDDDAVSGGDANEVSVSRISRHQVKRNKGGEASTSATAGAARVDNTSNDDAVIVNLYGGKNMEISRDKVFISLSYSPRTATLKRKFGNLPIGYMRERIDKEEDFKILDRVGRRYHFNLLDEQVAGLDNTWMEGEKRELYHQPPTLLMDDTDDDDAADTGGDANEVSVSRISRHQVKETKVEKHQHQPQQQQPGYGVNNMKISRDKVLFPYRIHHERQR